MASDGSSRSSSAADSYIGSLISLTSKSEIRYEGVLYNINAEESSIGLRNVRSFGTEGRKKEGQQIPPSDKIFEYILFRGSDIKDLQVKSSPPPIPINNDPAIIQSHYPQPVSTSTSLPSAVSGLSPDVSAHYPGGGLPLYQPGGTLGSWGAPPPPQNINGAGVGMPMYWQGYYGAPPQQSFMRPPNQQLMPPPNQQSMPPLSHQQPMPPPYQQPMPPPYQQPMRSPLQHPIQYPNFNLSLPQPTGASNLPEFPSSFLSASTSSSLTFSSSSTLPAPLPSVLSAPHASEILPLVNMATTSYLPPAPLNTNFSSLSPLVVSSDGVAVVAPIVNKPNIVPDLALPYQTGSHSVSSIGVSSNLKQTQTSTPSLVTPGQLLQSGPTEVLSQTIQTAHKDVEVVRVSSSELSAPVATDVQPPILPLPVPSRNIQKPNNAPLQTRHVYGGRERGRGTGGSGVATKFTEDFDFTAMNEKFNKDEVWGHLGKGSKSNPNDEYGDGKLSDEDDSQDDYDGRLSKAHYNKDDFFDSISSNALQNGAQNGRMRYSDQIKMDTETFGDFPRYRGGRGFMRGGHSGGHYGRGYGYGGRGRGRGRSTPTGPPYRSSQ